MTNKLVVIINSLKVPKIKKILPYEMKLLVPNYSCLQNLWLGGYRPQIPVLSVLCPQLNLLKPPPHPEQISWVRHWSRLVCIWVRRRVLRPLALGLQRVKGVPEQTLSYARTVSFHILPNYVIFNCAKVKVKVKQSHYRPGQTLRVPGVWGSQISRQSAHEGVKFVNHTHRPPLPTQEIFLVLISVRSWVDHRII